MHLKKKQKKTALKRKTSVFDTFAKCVFGFSLLFYCGSKVVLSAYNITLSKEEQSIAAQNNQKQDAVDELQITIRNLEDKKQVLGMLENQVQDNQNNIFIIGNNTE